MDTQISNCIPAWTCYEFSTIHKNSLSEACDIEA